MKIGIKIQKLRELRNLTQKVMATELDMSQSSYSRYESDDASWDFKKLDAAAKVLGMDPLEILNFNEDKLMHHIVNNNTFTAGSNPTIRNDISIMAEQERMHYEARIATLNEMVALLQRENARLMGKEGK